MPRDRKLYYKTLAALFFACCLIVAIWSIFIEPSRIVVSETIVRPPHLPAAFNETRIVVLADLHVGAPHISIEKLQSIVAQANELKPDLILLPGDFVVGHEFGASFVEPELIADALKKLRARHGVFAVLGNHDWWYYGARVRRALEAAGIQVLENESRQIQLDGETIWLAGFGDLWTGKPDIAATLQPIPKDAMIIAFTHNPDLFTRMPERVGLTIAGHTHGGQVNLPLAGRLVVPSDYGQRFAAGLVLENNHLLFVSTGIGTSILPLRFRVPPEISLLILAS